MKKVHGLKCLLKEVNLKVMMIFRNEWNIYTEKIGIFNNNDNEYVSQRHNSLSIVIICLDTVQNFV